MYLRLYIALFVFVLSIHHNSVYGYVIPEVYGNSQNTVAENNEIGTASWSPSSTNICVNSTTTPFASDALSSVTNSASSTLFIGNWGFTSTMLNGNSRLDWVRVSITQSVTGSINNDIIRLNGSCGELASLHGVAGPDFNFTMPSGTGASELLSPNFGFEIAQSTTLVGGSQLYCISILAFVSSGAVNSVTCERSPSPTPSISISPSASPSRLASISSSPSVTPSKSILPTPSPSANSSSTPSMKPPSSTPSQSPLPSGSVLPSPTVSATPTASPTISASVTATPTATASITPSTSPSPSLGYTPSSTTTPTVTPTHTPTHTPSLTPTTSASISVSGEPGRHKPSGGGGGDTGPIVGGVVGGLVALCAACGVLAFLMVRRRKQKKDHKKDDDIDVELDEHPKPTTTAPVAVAVTSTGSNSPYAAISTESASVDDKKEQKGKKAEKGSILDMNKDEIYITDVKLKGLLGKGKFGEVYEGLWSGTTPIALKKLKQEDKEEFENEIVLLRKLNHPNVVRCLGIWVNPQTSETFMALELLRLGSLTNFLRKQGTQSKLTTTDLVEMCINVASGMIYLEQKNIVHRDLGSRNLLVTETDGRYVVKVSDFGLSRQVEENDAVYSSKEGVFPVKWSPPEVINFRQFTTKSDVWSFGVTMWEIFEFGRVPYPTMSNEECVLQVMKGYRLAQPDTCPDSVYTIMMGCWNHDPALRPTFKLIHESLTKVLKELKGGEEEEYNAAVHDDPEKNYGKENYNNAPKDTYETYNNNQKPPQSDELYNNNQKPVLKPKDDLYNTN